MSPQESDSCVGVSGERLPSTGSMLRGNDSRRTTTALFNLSFTNSNLNKDGRWVNKLALEYKSTLTVAVMQVSVNMELNKPTCYKMLL